MRRSREHGDLVAEYLRAGFTKPQAVLLADKILDHRKPWRREIMAVACLVCVISALGWLKVGGVADSIQTNREEVTRQVCEDTNRRHDTTIDQLDALLDQAVARDPANAEQIRQSRDFTVALIDQLVPKRNCAKRVDQVQP